jgi:hypothetical protein
MMEHHGMHRDANYIKLRAIFEDFQRVQLSMSWIYGYIGEILSNLGIPVFAKPTEIHEKVHIYRLREHLAGESQDKANYVASLLGSSMLEKKLEDGPKIVAFLRGDRKSYDNVENFELVYDFKELTGLAGRRYTLPDDIFRELTAEEWEAGSAIRDLKDDTAKSFGEINRLRRLHLSTTLHAELHDFEIEKKHWADLDAAVRGEFHAHISRPSGQKNSVAAISPEGDLPTPNSPSEDSDAKPAKILSTGLKHDWIGFMCYVFALERESLLRNRPSLIKNPFADGAQKSVIVLMDEWFQLQGSVPEKNQKQQYANAILSAIRRRQPK